MIGAHRIFWGGRKPIEAPSSRLDLDMPLPTIRVDGELGLPQYCGYPRAILASANIHCQLHRIVVELHRHAQVASLA